MATIRELHRNGGTRRILMISTVVVPAIALATIIVGVAVSSANDARDIDDNTNRIERVHAEIVSLRQVDKEIANVLTDIRVQMSAVQKELELSRKLRENGH